MSTNEKDKKDDEKKYTLEEVIGIIVGVFILLILIVFVSLIIYNSYISSSHNDILYEKGQYSSPSYLKHISESPKTRNIYNYREI